MNNNKRIVWEEGLFVRPQHFQQESRYLENHINQRIDQSLAFMYGLTEIEFDENMLNTGVLNLVSARGVMPDGTCFNIPIDTGPLDPLAIGDIRVDNQIVYLALPIRTDSTPEVDRPEKPGNSRYETESNTIRDLHSRDNGFHEVTLAKLKPKLMIGSDESLSNYSTLAIAKIKNKDANNHVILDKAFYPTSLSITAAPELKTLLNQISGQMQEQAGKLAARLASPNQSGVEEVADFMLLQTLNRLYPEFQHLYTLPLLHPERLYEALAKACGELSTFQPEQRLLDDYPAYDHDQPWSSFESLKKRLFRMIDLLPSPRAVSIKLDVRGYAQWTATMDDRTLIDNSEFIIAVKADIEMSQLPALFSKNAKVAALEKIDALIGLQIPGIPFAPLPVKPQQLPYHAGYTYFQLDQGSQEWQEMVSNGTAGFAFYAPGDFPGLDIQFWAIRSH